MVVQNCGDACGEHGPGKRRPVQAQEEAGRQIRPPIQRREVDRTRVGKHACHVPRKAAIATTIPVPQTDTGGWGENPKADGRSIVKELGKMTP